MAEPLFIDRPPRIQPELPIEQFKIPAPPNKDEGGLMQLVQMALPLLMIVGYIALMGFGGAGRSPLLLLPMALSVIAATALSVYVFLRERRKREAAERAYQERLLELNREMHRYHDMQRRFYGYNYPDLKTMQRLPSLAQQEATPASDWALRFRSESRLWERRSSDEDFGVIRLGMGTLPSTVIYELEGGESFDDPLVRAAQKLDEDSRFVSQIPVILSLRAPVEEGSARQGPEGEEQVKAEEAKRTPFTHALGIAGAKDGVIPFVQALLAHFLVFHAPSDARLYVMGSSKQSWAWTDTAPHCQGDEQHRQCFFVDSDARPSEEAQGDDEEAPQELYLEGIRKLLAQRRLQLQEREGSETRGDPTLPLCLLVVDLLDSANDAQSPLADLEGDAALSILLAEGVMLGAAVIFLVPERGKVPSGCKSVIEIQRTTPATSMRHHEFQRLHFRYAETGLNSFRYVGEADALPHADDMGKLVAILAQMKVRESSGAAVASAVPFLPFMGYSSLAALEQDAARRWQASRRAEEAGWLRAKLGMMAGNKARTLVFSAKRDGVHGMVAGSTGSGKSELLISLITGMAVWYDPSVLNFVLVDFKGGGAFKEFADLPHCVDIITNLGGEGVTRMFTAIRAEMERRQGLNTETRTKNIVEYREKGLHLSGAPYPFLFIIIDEFAEMIAARAEYKSELETITRLGRAQGISLLLAAQRPTGVTDQMRSNIKFRICLRVETGPESRELLRRTDAFYLPGGVPGRGYLQVGNDEIELIQAAYSGDKVLDPQQALLPVLWVNRQAGHAAPQDQEPPPLYKAIIGSLKRLALELDVPEQRAPWPEFLPAHFSLSRLLYSDQPLPPSPPSDDSPQPTQSLPITAQSYLEPEELRVLTLGAQPDGAMTLNPALERWLGGEGAWPDPMPWAAYAMRPVVGLVDEPAKAKQHPLILELRRGHVALFGASGWGKTSFLRTLAVSLAATHSPQHLHLYLLDLGGRSLQTLEALPHVGAVIIPDEEGYQERVEQLLRELDQWVTERKTLLANTGMSDGDIYKFNEQNPSQAVPAIVVAIDNFAEFSESFGGDDATVESTLERFVTLARESRAYGIHFVVTASQPAVLSTQLYNIFAERLTLKLADTTDYRIVVGASVPEIGDLPGRGYLKRERQALSFQLALPLVADGERDESGASDKEELAQLAAEMTRYVEDRIPADALPKRVGALPSAVQFKQLLARLHPSLQVDEHFWDKLRDITHEAWAQSRSAEAADWLRVCFALAPGDREREMVLEAKADGVHGLIAGGTGAGKSELLMSLIVGLALRYDPSILNFVLVDYKGGGAFKPFDCLPHVVDSLTNIDKSAVRRMFTAINAEMGRRQGLNTATDTKDIIEYRRKGLHLSKAPYPHLFIIIDEYAEMISDSPEFKAELDSITRVGRAQGVHLLLAAQRPTGVTDQMRANIKFRICLRVEDGETSREMLRRSDAAFLPNGVPGRGYLQVGNDNIELLQVAYAGDEEQGKTSEEGRALKFFDLVVQMAQELLHSERPSTPWPEPLPTLLTLGDPLFPRYLHDEDRKLMTLEDSNQPLMLNPFAEAWLVRKSQWPGIDWERHALRAIVGLLDAPHAARQMPLLVDFNKGHAVIFGAAGWGKTTFFRTLVLSLAATHAPSELHIHLLALGGHALTELRALPHVGTLILPDEQGYEERAQQLLRELHDIANKRKKLFGDAGVTTLVEYNAAHPSAPEPAILVIIDNFAEYLENFGRGKDNDPANLVEVLVALMRQGKAYGLHFAVSADRLAVLSSKLLSLFTERLTLRLADPSEASSVVGGRVDEVGEVAGRGYARVARRPLAFQIALLPGSIEEKEGQKVVQRNERALLQQIGKRMAAGVWALPTPPPAPLSIEALPQNSSYRKLLSDGLALPDRQRLPESLSFPDALMAAMAQHWDQSREANRADWLQVTLGVGSGNRPRTLRLEAKRDGVHGLIAGGTGSGKSELLMTLIVGLALRYDPSILNFVLVDYKGGGAFKPFDRLPHVVDSVTNLNKAAVERMFTAINAEIRRRQTLNVQTETKDIVEYRQKGLHHDQPYSHLFVIIDEYAEMIDEYPDFRAQLESITRVGRAQGVNLLLASQRPKGVTDQMRANIKLRLCLRVEEPDTSIEMLRRPDAAQLPNGLPGRGYLQIGSETLELLQVSYTGEPQREQREAAALWPIRSAPSSAEAADEPPRLFDMVVALAAELNGEQMAPRLWPAFLPTAFSLQSPRYDAQKEEQRTLLPVVSDWLNDPMEAGWPGVAWGDAAMRAVVGLVDDPHEARQEPLTLDLSDEHLAIFGDSGWGKSALLRTLLVSLAATHSPDELHCYALDLAGRGFRSLEELPHLGAVLYADDDSFEERLHRLLDKLSQWTNERLQRFSEVGAATLYEYNQQHGERRSPRGGRHGGAAVNGHSQPSAERLPAILVLIDNFAPLLENHEALVESQLLPLLRRSLAAGISFVVTTNLPTGLPTRLSALFPQRLTFRQGDPDRYTDVVGRGATELDEIAGRGYLRMGGRPLLFQAALPVGLLRQSEGSGPAMPEADELERLASNMARWAAVTGHAWQTKPDPIPTLPETVPLRTLLESLPAPRPGVVEGLLGRAGSLQPLTVDLKSGQRHFVIAGPPGAGKTTLLYNWLLSLAWRYPPEQVGFVLIDLQRRFVSYRGMHSLEALPHVLACAYEIEEVAALADALEAEVGRLDSSGSRELFVLIDNFDDASEEIKDPLAQRLAALVRRYGESLHYIVAGSLEGTSSNELRRRLQSVGHGVGLRTSKAVEALRVARTPPALRDRELVVGRGYLVRAGQATLLQAASPYHTAQPGSVGVMAEEPLSSALDGWIEAIRHRYPGQQACWQAERGDAPKAPTAPASPKHAEMMALLQRILQWEAARQTEQPASAPLVAPALSAIHPTQWGDRDAMKPLMAAVRSELYRQAELDEEFINAMVSPLDPDSLIRELSVDLPSVTEKERSL